MFRLSRKQPSAPPEPPPQLETDKATEDQYPPDAVPVDESVLAHVLENIQKSSDATANELVEIKEVISSFNQHCERQNEIMGNCVKITNECQRNTEKFVNQELQRYVLYPAIEVVALLANHIEQLGQEFHRITAKHQLCELFGPLQNMITQSIIAAQQQMEHLDLHWITPGEFEKLSAQHHDIKQVIDVEDKTLHGNIKRTLIAGLLYRGTVLRRAQVAVYRYDKNHNHSLKGNQNENS